MKHKIVLILTILLFFWSHAFLQTAPKEKNAITKEISLALKSDSGYIRKMEGLAFLILHSFTDTTESYWKEIKETDTIGKYYRISATGNYIICFADYGKGIFSPTNLLLELNNKKTNIIKHVRYSHGTYPCCLNNISLNLNKIGDFYYINTCSTGSGFCSKSIYLFKSVSAPNKLLCIPLEMNWFMYGNFQILSSTMVLKDTILAVKYVYEQGIDINIPDSLKPEKSFQIKEKRDTFSVRYIYRNGNWIVLDRGIFNAKNTELYGL
jgi:hypothetical protein